MFSIFIITFEVKEAFGADSTESPRNPLSVTKNHSFHGMSNCLVWATVLLTVKHFPLSDELYYLWTTVIPFTVFLFFLVLYFYVSEEEPSPIPIEHPHRMTFSDVPETNVNKNTHSSSAAVVSASRSYKQTHSSSAQQPSSAQFYKISSVRQSKNSGTIPSHLKEIKFSKSHSKTSNSRKNSKQVSKSARISTQTIRSSKLTKKKTNSNKTRSSSLKKKRKLSLQMSTAKKRSGAKLSKPVVAPLDVHKLSGKRTYHHKRASPKKLSQK